MGQFQLKPSFAGGELTPALYGRTDLQKYDVGAATLENAIVLRYGGVTRRPGFKHIAQTKANKKARLIPFSYNAEQNYVIELTDKKARVYHDGALVKINNTVVEITTPYTEAELPQIKYAQSADMLFLVHPNHHPASITRMPTQWKYEVLDIDNGPFDDANTTDTKMRLIPLMWTNTGEEVKAPFFCDEAFASFASTHTQATATGHYITTDPDAGFSGVTVTPVSDTIFGTGPLTDIWLRCDILETSIGNEDGSTEDLYFSVYFDNDTTKDIGVYKGAVFYKDGNGTWVDDFGTYWDSDNNRYNSNENYIGSQAYDGTIDYDDPNHDEPAEWGNPIYTYCSAYLTPSQFTARTGEYADMTYHNKEYVKMVVHISTTGVWVYHNDHLVYSQEAPQGNAITHIITSPYDSWVSNIIIANFDCSDMTLVGGGGEGDIDVSGFYRGTTAILESSDSTNPVFADDMVGQLVRLGHTVPAYYRKGVPGTDDLTVRCVPGASVYVESFGFWEGHFEVFKKDDLEEWVSLKKQSGNRSQNYNMTFQNDDDVLRYYKVDSDDFDNSVKGDEDPDQRGYVTIQSFSNDYDGIVRIKEIIDSRHALVEITKEVASSKWTLDWSLQAWSPRNGYPQAVGFFEDRMVYAGSPKHPQTYWTSKTGSYLDFGTSYPGKDNDAITGTLATGQMNGIKAIVSFDEMVMLTTGGEYRVSGGGSNFTPTTQQAKAQEYRGITDVPPVIIGGRILYVQRGGSIIRDLAYSYDVDKYTGGEISILASHLFDGHEIVSMTYQQAPESVLWCVRSDGVMVAMTYIHEQDVYAWHRHTTQGKFIDVCSIPGETEDELWAVVKRGDNYYVERMTKQEDNVYVDSAAIYDGTATSTVTGLSWLASESVQVVGDGNKLTDEEISAGGQLDVDNEFTHIVTGLAYDTNVVTLPVEINGQDGSWGSRKKRVQRMCVMFKDTLGGRFGFDGKALDEIKWRSTEAYNEAVSAYTGKKHITLPQANYEDTIMLQIKQPDPFPMTILSIIPEILPGG